MFFVCNLSGIAFNTCAHDENVKNLTCIQDRTEMI